MVTYPEYYSQQTFVLMKTSFKMSSSRRICSSQPYVFRRRLLDVFKISQSRPIYSYWSYVFKTSSRRLAKTSSRRLAKTSSRSLQNFFKTIYKDIFKAFTRLIIKLNYLLLTSLRQVFNTFLRPSFPKTVIHRGICLNRTMSEKFIVSHGTKFARQIKISQVLVFHFTTPFSGCLEPG